MPLPYQITKSRETSSKQFSQLLEIPWPRRSSPGLYSLRLNEAPFGWRLSTALSRNLGTLGAYNPLMTTSVDDCEEQSPASVSLMEGPEWDVAKSRHTDVGEPALSLPGEATP